MSKCDTLHQAGYLDKSTVYLLPQVLYSYAVCLGYKIPRHGKLEDILDFIEHLPPVDSPEALGLHPNADITYQSNMAKDILDTIMNIQPKDSSGLSSIYIT